MRKIFMFNLITLDGFFAGPNGDIDWHNVDAEFNEFAIEQLGEIGTLIFGRITYELMASYWPTTAAVNDDPIVADKMNSLPKIVVSRTLEKADWNNTRLIKDNVPAEIQKLKEQPGKDMAIFGSASLVASLIQHDLIDEFRIIISPIILGSGKPLFPDIKDKMNLKLTKTRAFSNGNVLLYYVPVK